MIEIPNNIGELLLIISGGSFVGYYVKEFAKKQLQMVF